MTWRVRVSPILRVHESIEGIGEPAWAALTSSAPPFLSYAWLRALEASGCVGPRRGWTPCYLTLSRGETLIGAVPAFIKTHSQGEFVFDHAWAQYAETKLGLRYYPKLVVCVPFTPAGGPRLLVRPGEARPFVVPELLRGLRELTDKLGLSSYHVLFPEAGEARELADAGLLLRHGMQFHWQNHGYSDFTEFLGAFSSKRRHQIRRELRALTEQGTILETISGRDLTPDMADLAHDIYGTTVDKFFYGRRYLNRAFFEEVCSKLQREIRFVIARDADTRRPIAGAFNLASKETLFGRYWGALEERPFLHFNVCFYHSIAECIRIGLQRFEPGAGGEHKLARGFEPVLTHSLHYLAAPELERTIGEFLERERAAYRAELDRYLGQPVLHLERLPETPKTAPRSTSGG